MLSVLEPAMDQAFEIGFDVRDIGFRGVLPGCDLMCVAIPFGLNVKPMIRALLYCVACEVDAILIPCSIYQANDLDRVVLDKHDPKVGADDFPANPSDINKQQLPNKELNIDSKALDWLLEHLATRIPLIVASGNNGLKHPEYTATPQCKDMIIVGAQNIDGHLTS